MSLFLLGMHRLRGERPCMLKERLHQCVWREAIDTDKHHKSVNWQTVLFFFFSSSSSSSRRERMTQKIRPLFFTLEEKMIYPFCSHFNHSRKSLLFFKFHALDKQEFDALILF